MTTQPPPYDPNQGGGPPVPPAPPPPAGYPPPAPGAPGAPGAPTAPGMGPGTQPVMPYGAPAVGPQGPYGAAPGPGGPGVPPPGVPPKKSRTGLVIGIVIGAFVLVVGLAVGAWFLFMNEVEEVISTTTRAGTSPTTTSGGDVDEAVGNVLGSSSSQYEDLTAEERACFEDEMVDTLSNQEILDLAAGETPTNAQIQKLGSGFDKCIGQETLTKMYAGFVADSMGVTEEQATCVGAKIAQTVKFSDLIEAGIGEPSAELTTAITQATIDCGIIAPQ